MYIIYMVFPQFLWPPTPDISALQRGRASGPTTIAMVRQGNGPENGPSPNPASKNKVIQAIKGKNFLISRGHGYVWDVPQLL